MSIRVPAPEVLIVLLYIYAILVPTRPGRDICYILVSYIIVGEGVGRHPGILRKFSRQFFPSVLFATSMSCYCWCCMLRFYRRYSRNECIQHSFLIRDVG